MIYRYNRDLTASMIKRIFKTAFFFVILSVLFLGVSTYASETVNNEQEIQFLYIDSQGETIESLTHTAVIGSVITLPYVPGHANAKSSGWKLDRTIPDENADILAAGSTLTLSVNSDILSHANEKGQIILYAVNGYDPCTLTYYDNSGQNVIYTYVIEYGSKVTLESLPVYNAYYSLGWARSAGASAATYTAGQVVTLQGNADLYAVYKERPAYKVTFANNAGKSTSAVYKALAVTVLEGKKVTLPQVPAVKGYKALGWALSAKQTTAKYSAGAKVTITGKKTFYAVYKKLANYTVTFLNMNGSTDSGFASLTKKVQEGTKITLPSLPSVSGYSPLGWALNANQTSAKYVVGKTLTISKNLTFYAVYTGACTVTLHSKNGSIWKTAAVKKGASYTLPGVKPDSGYTMMGWSYSPNKSVDAELEVGEQIKVTKNCNLYAVIFDRKSEPDLTSSQMLTVDTARYDQVIFVGDSRTVRMERTLVRMDNTSFLSNVYFIASGGKGLSWLQSTAYAELLNKVSCDKKTAVVFNFGVNDLSKSSAYVAYLNKIASTLQGKGCTLYLMSVNPVNGAQRSALGDTVRKESSVRKFNAVLSAGLAGSYTYINTYQYLMQTGFGFDSGVTGTDTGTDDGLHYSTRTYKRIFNKCMEYIFSN